MKDILFYGGGNIAQSVIEGLIKSGYPKNNIYYKDRNITNQKKLKKLIVGIPLFSEKKNNMAMI